MLLLKEFVCGREQDEKTRLEAGFNKEQEKETDY
jgi:hypothetical protein